MGFPTKINYSLPAGYPGAIASANPRRCAIAPDGGFRAGAKGLSIGHFAWVAEDGVSLSNTPPASNKNASPAGFIIRDMTAILSSLENEASLILPPGFPAPIFTGGDFWAVSGADTKAGDPVFADPSDGSVSSTGIPTGFSVTRGGSAGQTIMISAPCAPMPTALVKS